MDYTAIGDMVNTASRIGGLTWFYREPLLNSSSVWREVRTRYPCRFVDKVEVKGCKGAVSVFTARRVNRGRGNDGEVTVPFGDAHPGLCLKKVLVPIWIVPHNYAYPQVSGFTGRIRARSACASPGFRAGVPPNNRPYEPVFRFSFVRPRGRGGRL